MSSVAFLTQSIDSLSARSSLTPPPLLISGNTLPETHLPASLICGTRVPEADFGPVFLAQPSLVDHFVQLVDLLERQAFGLVDHRPHKAEADEAERAPDEEHLGLQVGVFRVDHVRRRICDREVEDPVGRCCHAECFGAHFERE